MSEKPLVLVADDGSGRVWIVEDAGKAWFRAGGPQIGSRSRMPNCREPQDLYDHFASTDPEVAEMLLTVRALALK